MAVFLGLGALVPVKGNLYATHYTMAAVCFKQFVETLFLFQHGNAPRAQAEVHREMLFQFGAKDLDWPPQSPDLKPGLIARQQRPTSLMLVAECDRIPAARF